MNKDFRVSVDFFTHPKTENFEDLLGEDLEIIGVLSLLKLWARVAKHKPDGDISGLCEREIEVWAKWKGEKGVFLNAAVEAGFIDKDESGYSLHDWTDHNPWAADAVARSDSSRLSRMAKTHPELYERLKAEGYKGISQKEYWSLTHEERVKNEAGQKNNERSTNVNESLNESESGVKPALSPAPSPSPSPVPTPIVKDNNTPLVPPGMSDGEQKALDALREIPGYPFDPEKDLEHVRRLKADFPKASLTQEFKRIRDWIDDNDGKKKIKNYRLLLRKWVEDAAKNSGKKTTKRRPRQSLEEYLHDMGDDPLGLRETDGGGAT